MNIKPSAAQADCAYSRILEFSSIECSPLDNTTARLLCKLYRDSVQRLVIWSTHRELLPGSELCTDIAEELWYSRNTTNSKMDKTGSASASDEFKVSRRSWMLKVLHSTIKHGSYTNCAYLNLLLSKLYIYENCSNGVYLLISKEVFKALLTSITSKRSEYTCCTLH